MHSVFARQLQDNPELQKIIQQCIDSNDFYEFDEYLFKLRSQDEYLNPENNTKSGMKYYMPFHFAVFEKVRDAYIDAIKNSSLPIVKVSFSDIDQHRKKLGFDSYGSPQDVLYGFTSERYKKWGGCLTNLFFQSGSMAGAGEMYVTTAPRYLELDGADVVIDEIDGAIPIDFWETQDVLQRNSVIQVLDDLRKFALSSDGDLYPKTYSKSAAIRIIGFLNRIVKENDFDNLLLIRVNYARDAIETYLDSSSAKKASPFRKTSDHNQEQIAMKYADEGRYIQKILSGRKVEHVQSNVKMVVNPLRGNKCEVDSIYRVLGKKEIVLLEAKGKNSVSIGQLYQIYETYKLRLPKGWNIRVLALLLSSTTEKHIRTIVDVVEVDFEEALIGSVAESMHSIKIVKHYKWNILTSN